MSRSSTLKPILGVLLAAATAVLVITVVSGSSGAGDEPGPKIVGVENACKALYPPLAESAKVVYGKGADNKPEMTEWAANGAYRVTRCTTDGELVVRQHVVPVQTPDGLQMLATETVTPTQAISSLLPESYTSTPAAIKVWNETGDKALSHVIPPTPETGN